MLEARGLGIGFGGVRALDDVSFAVREGEIRGIIGPNGAGKTTLLNVICGLVRPDAGEVLLAGEPITGLKPNVIAGRGLGRTFQTSQLFRGMTVLENLMTGLHGETRAGLFAAAFGGRAMLAEEERAREKAWKALEFVGMERFWDRPAQALSFGQQRVVEIARTLISEPKVVLLDEPAVGLSLNRLAELDRLLRRIRDERGVTLVMIEHVIRLVMGVCDRVTVLQGGVVIAEGTPDAVIEDARVIEAYLGRRVDARRRAS
ncbi:MAG: ABC transporter ATP-binding protein [Alphaproteobacteria bacterium]|nr:ABC transporter ATP-binding protein [Alphaproteobacteria bacterium]